MVMVIRTGISTCTIFPLTRKLGSPRMDLHPVLLSTVTGSYGQIGMYTWLLLVQISLLLLSLHPPSGNTPMKVSFTDRSTGTPTSWKWSLGDGTSSTTQNPVHKYCKAGRYTVSLTVSNAAGSNALTKSSYIVVNSLKVPVVASASPTSGNKPLTVKFFDKSTEPLTSYLWNFGDKNTSTAEPCT